MSAPTPPPGWAQSRRDVLRDALGVAVATGAYGVSFGALSVAAGLDVVQTCALSALMFTGGSQFAFIGVLGGGGSAVSAVSTAVLLGLRNAMYGLRMASILEVRGLRQRLVGAQLVIDESVAMAVGRDDRRAAQLGFWSTGLAIYVFWNLATLIGALAGEAIGDPRDFGLDAAAPAAFLALLWPRLHDTMTRVVAGCAAALALLLVPVAPVGVPVIAAGLVAVAAGWRAPRRVPTGDGDA